jgi:hypothetical protein
MADLKTSINIKKFWYSDLAADGDVGTDWQEVQIGQREASVQFNGSDADVTNHKNVLGGILESSRTKGDTTMNFQLADLTPEVIAAFTGGTVSSSAASNKFEAPENQNQVIEKSIKFLSDKNVLFIIPRCSFDGYPIINDDDLHYYQMNSVALVPEKSGVPIYTYHELLQVSENDILTFDIFDANGDSILTGAAVITPAAHTVVAEVVNGSGLNPLTPTITASLGASIDPAGGLPQDFTAPVLYEVEAADGTKQVWTITVTEAA